MSFNPTEHPRDKDGEFAPKGSSGASASPTLTPAALATKLEAKLHGDTKSHAMDGQAKHQLKNDPDKELLLKHGAFQSGAGKVMKPRDDGSCHWNVAAMHAKGEIDHIVVGYALNESAGWHQHTWGEKGGKIIETTPSNADATRYYGMKLSPAQAKQFKAHTEAHPPGGGVVRFGPTGKLSAPEAKPSAAPAEGAAAHHKQALHEFKGALARRHKDPAAYDAARQKLADANVKLKEATAGIKAGKPADVKPVVVPPSHVAPAPPPVKAVGAVAPAAPAKEAAVKAGHLIQHAVDTNKAAEEAWAAYHKRDKYLEKMNSHLRYTDPIKKEMSAKATALGKESTDARAAVEKHVSDFVESHGGNGKLANDMVRSWAISSSGGEAVHLRVGALRYLGKDDHATLEREWVGIRHAAVALHMGDGADIGPAHHAHVEKLWRPNFDEAVATPKTRESVAALAMLSQAAHDKPEVVLYRGVHGQQATAIREAIARGDKHITIATGAISSWSESAAEGRKFAHGSMSVGANGVVLKVKAKRETIAFSHKAAPQLDPTQVKGKKEVVIFTPGALTINAEDIEL